MIQSARDTAAELYDPHRFDSNTQHLEFIDSFLPDSQYLFPVAQHVEGSAHVLNPKKKVSKSANEWPAYTLLPGRRIVTNGSGLSHQVRVRVRVHTESLPYWCSGLSIPLNLQLGYSSIEISLPHLNVPGCQQVAQRVHLSIQRRLLCLQFDNCALSKSRIQQALIYFRVFCGSQY